MIRGAVVVVVMVLALAACNQTTYVRQGPPPAVAAGTDTPAAEEDPALPVVERRVTYGLTKEYFQLAPRCVMVLPLETDGSTDSRAVARALEDAVARNLAIRFARVVSAGQVADARRRLALLPGDLKRLGQSLDCRTAMEIASPGFERTYVLIWAEARLPLALQLLATDDGSALWWGRHAAERSEGGLPFDVFSVPLKVFSAGRFAGDGDVLPSMADDVSRRVLESLPGLKTG